MLYHFSSIFNSLLYARNGVEIDLHFLAANPFTCSYVQSASVLMLELCLLLWI